MLEAARGWFTPGVLFVLVNLVVITIAVASKLMPQAPEDAAADERRRGGLLRSPSLAINRLRSTFSFSRYGLPAAADHAPPLFDDATAVGVNQDPYPSPHTPAVVTGTWAPPPEAEERGEAAARVERTQSEAAAAVGDEMRRPRARRMRRAATEEEAALVRVAGRRGEEAPAAVDERADDFIRRFREQLRVQRLDSILRRTGTA